MLHEREENLFCSECGDEFSTQVCAETLLVFDFYIIYIVHDKRNMCNVSAYLILSPRISCCLIFFI